MSSPPSRGGAGRARAPRRPAFAIKVEVADPKARTLEFPRQKTMYGGKLIVAGDVVFVFDSENEGGSGLLARGVVVAASAVPRRAGLARQTPRVSVVVKIDHRPGVTDGLRSKVAAVEARLDGE